MRKRSAWKSFRGYEEDLNDLVLYVSTNASLLHYRNIKLVKKGMADIVLRSYDKFP